MRKGAVLSVAVIGAAFLGALRFAQAQPARAQGFRMLSGLAAPAVREARVAFAELESERAARDASAQKSARLEAALRPMPDLTQTDPALGVIGGGESWCGPVAVSNALAYLGSQGRESLIPTGETAHDRQLALVRLLGSSRYMGTTPNGGTGTANLLRGLHSYLRDTGWGYRRLQYQGWRGHPSRFTTGVKSAELAFLRKALDEGGVAVIHAGWYTPSKYGGDFHRRHGGHWLTVVGAGVDEEGRPAEDSFVVHDPAPYAGAPGQRHFVKLERLESGWLLAEDGAFPAKGFSRLGGGMKIKIAGDIAVLDGAVALVP